jgi:hypothetical protein
MGLMLLGSSTRRLVTLLTDELVARFDVLAAALLKTGIFRDVTVFDIQRTVRRDIFL